MIYDCTRTLGLIFSVSINVSLIQLSKTMGPDADKLASQITRKLVLLCHSSMLLKSNDKLLKANAYHIYYSMQSFKNIIEFNQLAHTFLQAYSYVTSL